MSTAGEEAKILEDVKSRVPDDMTSDTLYKLGPHVNVEFNDIFEESIDYQQSNLGQSIGTKVNHGCLQSLFDKCNSGTFYVLSVLIGWLSALVCGLIFGVNMALQIWCVQPCIKLIFTWLRLCFACNRAYVRACFDPIFQSVGQCLAYIRGSFTTEKVEQRPTAAKEEA